jgi:hypothetical protein
MKGIYISVGIMTALVLAAVIYGFVVVGSPWAVRGYKLDDTRVSDFSTIQSAAQEFYNSNNRLPNSIAELASSTVGSYYATQNIFTDPSTQQAYDYKVTSATGYQLCTTFAASSQEESQNDSNYVSYPVVYGGAGTLNNQHPAGYGCIAYSVSGTGAVVYPQGYPQPYPATSTIKTQTSSTVSDTITIP